MISGLQSGGIYHGEDRERALKFWTETLGFEVMTDTPMADGTHWTEVAPPNRRSLLVLYTPPQLKARVGTFSNLIFECADVQATYKELTAKGVQFVGEPIKAIWGWWAVFRDPDGNAYGLREPVKPGTPVPDGSSQEELLPPIPLR